MAQRFLKVVDKKDKKKNLVDVHVNKNIAKEFEKVIKSGGVKDVKYSHTQKSKEKDMAIVFIETKKKIAFDDMRLGVVLSSLKESLAKKFLMQEKQRKQSKEVDPIRLKVPNEIIKQLKAAKEELSIKKFVAKQEGGYTDAYFDVSMCIGRGQLVKRILAIQDAINSFRNNFNNRVDSDYISSSIAELNEKMPNAKKTSTTLVEMTGKELIKQGYAVSYRVLSSKYTIGKMWEMMFGKRVFEHYYMEQLVDVDRKYIVMLKRPIAIPSTLVDHAKEVLLHYNYGQQIYEGYGTKYVEKYVKTMSDILSKAVIESEFKKQ